LNKYYEYFIMLLLYAGALAVGVILRSMIYKWKPREMFNTYMLFFVIGAVIMYFQMSCG